MTVTARCPACASGAEFLIPVFRPWPYGFEVHPIDRFLIVSPAPRFSGSLILFLALSRNDFQTRNTVR